MNFYKKLGEIRPNQLITTYGPGSIMDLQLLIIVLKLTKKMEPLFLLSIYQESRILILKDYIEICKLDSIFIQINLLYI